MSVKLEDYTSGYVYTGNTIPPKKRAAPLGAKRKNELNISEKKCSTLDAQEKISINANV